MAIPRAPHPWVTETDAIRFGVLVTGGDGKAPDGSWNPAANPIRDLVAAGRVADEAGLDGVYVAEDPRSMTDPFVALAALAAVTERVRLGTMIAIPFLRHPVLLARQAADIDRLSGGRFVLGLGIGESAAQFATVDAAWSGVRARQDALNEAINLIRASWSGQPVYQRGQYFSGKLDGMQPPVQKPGPPILIGGAGPRTMSLAAANADALNFGSTWGAETPELVREKLTALRQVCADAGRDPATLLPTFLGLLILGETEEALQRKVREQMTEENFRNLTASGWLVTGTPEQVADYYRARVEAGMRLFIASLGDTNDHDSIRLLAEVAKLVNA